MEYFYARGWTGFGDLPVRLICRRPLPEIALAPGANQFAENEIVARMSHAICGANADNTGVLSI